MTAPAAVTAPDGPLAIICGGGSIPRAVAEAVVQSGRPVVLFPITGSAEPGAGSDFRHHWVALGQVGRFRRLALAEGCRDVVFIGTVQRPAITQIRLDWLTLRQLPLIVRSFRGGDNHLLSGMSRILEGLGFRLLGSHEVAPGILVPEGPLGGRQPSARDHTDIALALSLLKAMGPFDVGQAAVVADGHVLAVEAAEGTDRVLARVAELRHEGRIRTPSGAGVLVKAPKPGQDLRFDLPTIGPQTIDGVVRAGLAGIAVVARAAIMADPERMAQRADDSGVFVVGIPGQTGA